MRKIKHAALASRGFQIAFLFVANFFAKPQDFVALPDRPMARYARFRWLNGLPAIPAGIIGHQIVSAVQWMGVHKQLEDRVPDQIFDRFLSQIETAGILLSVGIGVLIYAIAGMQWVYHRGAVTWWRRTGRPGFVAPLRYFIVITAASWNWIALFVYAIVKLIKSVGPDFGDAIDGFVHAHIAMTVAVLAIVMIDAKRITANRERGMRQIYGGTWHGLALADGVLCGVAVVGLVAILRFGLR